MKKTIISLFLFNALIISAQSWNVTGNSGTNSTTNFIGTTDNQDLAFKTNNLERIRINNNGRFILQNLNVGSYGWDNNLFFGGGNDISTGLGNTVFGLAALSYNTTGAANTAVGSNALRANLTGTSNTAFGVNSMMANTAGSENTAVGLNSLGGSGTINHNTAIGFAAMSRYNANNTNSVSYNTGIGWAAIGNIINGNNNTALGGGALRTMTTGNNNIAIGYNSAVTLTSGNNNILIGNNINTSASTADNQLNIGNWIYGQNGKIGIGGLSDVNLGLKVYGRTQIKSDINSDGFAVLNDISNVDNGASLVFLRYGQYQPNNPGVLDVSGFVSPSLYEQFFSLKANGKLFLGTSTNLTCSDCSTYRLFVKDGIRTEKIKVDIASVNGWADYVFKKDYKLASLEDVETYINNMGHLPNIPSADELVKNGLDLAKMDAKLLEKIEELTLYNIDLYKSNKILKDQLNQQQLTIDMLLQKVEKLEANLK
ncbi:hypothetical protein [Epilithonimonas zeae]|uniref:hypothetical protein n=1 Tax=Epilithonimonas zeae TaxID=1416779 RepID=UPI00200E8B7D|nr:hypothetical protein [Epilithonimonas zeae]UQB68879.1 hypothetical protein KI430_00070 [Epilithonimonas zeae]